MAHLISKKYQQLLFVTSLLILVVVGRIRYSFVQLPFDPGFDRMREVKLDGIAALWSRSLGYFDVSARIPPLFAASFRLRDQAVVLSGITAMITVVLAIVIFSAIFIETSSFLRGLISSILFAAVPSAALSTVGNHGSLKWPLFATLGVVACSPKTMKAWPRATVALAIIVGLSNPFAILCGFGLLIPQRFRFGVNFAQRNWVRIALVCTTATQIVAWRFSGFGAHLYGSNGVYGAWPGMGVLWYWVWVGPLVCALTGVAAFLLFKSLRSTERGWFAIRIVAVSLVIFSATYIESGIKDSMSVASQSLASIGLVLIMIEIIGSQKILMQLAAAAGIVLVLASTFRWYTAQGELFRSVSWSVLVDKAASDCRISPEAAPVIQDGFATIDLSCEEIALWG